MTPPPSQETAPSSDAATPQTAPHPEEAAHSPGSSARSWLPGWLRPFFGVVLRPFLLAIVALVLGILWAGAGEHYGVPDLFWNENAFAQFLAGIGVTLLLLHVCFTAYLLDTRKREAVPGWEPGRRLGLRKLVGVFLPVVEEKTDSAKPSRWAPLRWYLSLTWLPLVVLLILSTFVYPTARLPWAADSIPPTGASAYWGQSPAPGSLEGPVYVFLVAGSHGLVFGLLQRWPFLVGIAAAVLVLRALAARLPRVGPGSQPFDPNYRATALHAITAAAFLFVFLVGLFAGAPDLLLYFLLGLWTTAHAVIVGLAALRRVRPERRWLHRTAAFGFGAWYLTYQGLFILYAIDVSFLGYRVSPWLAPPALVICLLLGLLTAVYGFFSFHFRRCSG